MGAQDSLLGNRKSKRKIAENEIENNPTTKRSSSIKND